MGVTKSNQRPPERRGEVVAEVWGAVGGQAAPPQAWPGQILSLSLFIFQPFELTPWSRARGGGRFFETTEIWFHPKKENGVGAADDWGGWLAELDEWVLGGWSCGPFPRVGQCSVCV